MRKSKKAELSYGEVLHMWAETHIGVGKMPKGFSPKQCGGTTADVHGTREMCARIVETFPGYSKDFGKLLIRYMFQGVEHYDEMKRCEDFQGALALSLIEHPVYFMFKSDEPTTEPTEYTQTKLAEALGFSHAKGAQKWMLAHGCDVPGVNQFGASWWMVDDAFKALKKFRENFLKKDRQNTSFPEEDSS